MGGFPGVVFMDSEILLRSKSTPRILNFSSLDQTGKLTALPKSVI